MALKHEPDHWGPAAELMAREGLTLREAASRLGVPLTGEAATAEFRSKAFQRVLRTARNRFYREIAGDPEWSKRTAIGMMLQAAERLMEEGQFEKVMTGMLQLAKVEGWVGSDNAVTVFAGITHEELQQVRERTKERLSEKLVN